MSERPRFCETHDGPICQGVNGFKSIVNGFAGGGDKTSAPPTASGDAATTPPPEVITSAPEAGTERPPPLLPPSPPPPSSTPPRLETTTTSLPPEAVTESAAAPPNAVPPPGLLSPLPQESSASTLTQSNVLAPAVVLPTTTSRGSFIEILPTRTALSSANNPLVPSIFASSELSSITADAGTTTLSPVIETVTASPEISPGATQGAIENGTTKFPTAVVAGVCGGVIAFIFIFALFWRHFIRKHSLKTHVSIADEKGLVQSRGQPHDLPAGHEETTEISTVSKYPKSDDARFSWAATAVSLDSDLEPLSPKPVIRQTVYKMSVPVPVEASSFRTNSKEISLRGSLSPPSSTYQRVSLREALTKQGRDSKGEPPTHSQVPATRSSSKQEDTVTQPEEAEEMGEPKQVSQREGTEEGPGLQRQYTLRTSPLHQNPFKDQVEEEVPLATPASLVFTIMNADTPHTRIVVNRESVWQGEDREESSFPPTRATEISEQQKD